MKIWFLNSFVHSIQVNVRLYFKAKTTFNYKCHVELKYKLDIYVTHISYATYFKSDHTTDNTVALLRTELLLLKCFVIRSHYTENSNTIFNHL